MRSNWWDTDHVGSYATAEDLVASSVCKAVSVQPASMPISTAALTNKRKHSSLQYLEDVGRRSERS